MSCLLYGDDEAFLSVTILADEVVLVDFGEVTRKPTANLLQRTVVLISYRLQFAHVFNYV